MRVLCAWCRRDGKPGDLGEREPLENADATHGICVGHSEQVLACLPSRSLPRVELLVIVRRKGTAFYERLNQSFTGVPGVKVIIDRRVADRRTAACPVADERRYVKTRRIRQGTMSPLGTYTVVRFTPKGASPPR